MSITDDVSIKYPQHVGLYMPGDTLFGLDTSEVNHVTYHVVESLAVHTQITEDELDVKEYYSHAYISGPGAERFVEKMCGDERGQFDAKLKASPLVDDVDHYHYAIK